MDRRRNTPPLLVPRCISTPYFYFMLLLSFYSGPVSYNLCNFHTVLICFCVHHLHPAVTLMLKSLSKPTTKSSEIRKNQNKKLRFPSQLSVCGSWEPVSCQCADQQWNSDLSSAVQYDLTDQNLNGKERFCQCFSLVGLVSGQKQIFMDVSKAIHLIRKAYLSLTWPAYAQFMWELSKLVIWPAAVFSSELRFHTTGGAFCNPRTHNWEDAASNKNFVHRSDSFFSLSLSHNLETEVKIWQGYVLVEGGG